MRLFRSILPAIVVAIAFAPVARAEDKVESPIYKNWAKFAKGTSTTVKTISEFAGNKSEATMTSTLLELTDEKVVVEIVTISKVAGMEFKSPAVKQDYPATEREEGRLRQADGQLRTGRGKRQSERHRI